MKKLLVAAVLLMMTSIAVSAQTVGVIDYEKVQDTPLFKSIAAEISEADQNFSRELELRQTNVYLTETEVLELIAEASKNANSARAKELQDENAKRDAEYTTLSQANPPSDEQKKRIDELSNMRKKSEANFNNVRADMANKMDTLIQEKQTAFDAKVADACKTVAAEKKLTVIVMKTFVLFGGTDVTQDVIGKLPASL